MTHKILNSVCHVFAVTMSELKGGRRHRNVANARLCAAHLLTNGAKAGSAEVSAVMQKSRAWSYYAIKRCEDLVEVDRSFSRLCASAHHGAQEVAS